MKNPISDKPPFINPYGIEFPNPRIFSSDPYNAPLTSLEVKKERRKNIRPKYKAHIIGFRLARTKNEKSN